MTQAVNLANFANSLNSSGQLDPAALSSAVPVSKGGTGATSLTGYVYGNGTSAMTASTTIPGSAISGNIPGNAATATELQTTRTINGTNFNGSANITTSTCGTSRTVSLTGAVTGSASVNGSANVSIATTLDGASAKAWVNFNGNGGSSIRAGYNVSSVTRNAANVYTINMTSALSDTNYAYMGFARQNGDGTTGYSPILVSYLTDTKTTSAFKIRMYGANNGDPQYYGESPEIDVVVFR